MKVTFENGTISDSIAKAARVAPTKGQAFDKASGILMTLDSSDNTVILRSTNLDIFYFEVVQALDVESDATWRFHAGTLAQVMAKLPIGSGKTVTMTQNVGEVVMQSGRTKAKFRLIDASYYPTWDPFDPASLEMVTDLGSRIRQVEWASVTGDEQAYAGIHLTGTHVMATDRFRLAVVECEAEPIYKPITIPAGILKPVLANMRDVAVGMEGGMFLMMPDQSTQISTRIFEKEYPKVQKLMDQEWPNKVKFKKARLLEIIDRAAIFAQNDRNPKMQVMIGQEEIAVMCEDQEMGLLGDVIEVPGQAVHPRVYILFVPKNLSDGLLNSPSDEVEVYYDAAGPTRPMKIDGGSGYQALIMPRKEMKSE